MRSASHVGFSRHILRIRSRVSRAIGGRPRCPRRTFQVQNKRKPMRCQATTVCGLTMLAWSANRAKYVTEKPRGGDRRKLIWGVSSASVEARRFDGAEPGFPAGGQIVNG